MSSYRLSSVASITNRHNTAYRQSAPAISTAVESVGSRAVQHGVANGDQYGFDQHQFARPNLSQITMGFPRPAHQHPNPLGHGLPAYRPTSIQHDAPLDLSRSSLHGSASMANRPLDLSRPSPPDLVPMLNAALPAEAQTSVDNVRETKTKKKAALNQTFIEYRLPVTDDDRDVEAFFRSQESNIRDSVEEAIQRDM